MMWHKMCTSCPNCEMELTVLAVNMSADGEILFSLICVRCGVGFHFLTSGAQLIARSVLADVREDEVVRPSPGLPEKKPLTIREVAASDVKWLREMGIKG